MYYISDITNGRLVVTDTKDGVSEQYAPLDIKEFVMVRGMKVIGAGVDENGCFQVSRVQNFQGNLLECNAGRFSVYNIEEKGKVFEITNRDIRLYDDRNEPYIVGVSFPARGRYRSKSGVGISLTVSVKYDVEFYGQILGVFYPKTPSLTNFLSEVMYFDANPEVIQEQTCGDCPNFEHPEVMRDIFKKRLGLDYIKQ